MAAVAPWPRLPSSATTARPAPAAARRSNSARRSRRTRSAPIARAPWCARATRWRASARWPSCSTTSARCSCSPPAASRTSPSRWSAGCSTATPAAAGPNGSPRSTTAAPAILGEDNGAYVFSLPVELQRAPPPAGRACASAPPPPSTARPTPWPPTSRSRWSRRRASCRACPSSAALRGGRAAQRPGPGAQPRLRHRAARRLPRPRGAARGTAAHRPARRIGQGREGPQLQLPATAARRSTSTWPTARASPAAPATASST